MNVSEAQTSIETKQDQGLQDLVYGLVSRFLVENKSKSIDYGFDK